MTVVPGTKLSPRQEEILYFIRTTDLSYFDIGLLMTPKKLSESTVATHAKRAFKRLGVCGRVGYLVSISKHAA